MCFCHGPHLYPVGSGGATCVSWFCFALWAELTVGSITHLQLVILLLTATIQGGGWELLIAGSLYSWRQCSPALTFCVFLVTSWFSSPRLFVYVASLDPSLFLWACLVWCDCNRASVWTMWSVVSISPPSCGSLEPLTFPSFANSSLGVAH